MGTDIRKHTRMASRLRGAFSSLLKCASGHKATSANGLCFHGVIKSGLQDDKSDVCVMCGRERENERER
jgi:hypothetical protein